MGRVMIDLTGVQKKITLFESATCIFQGMNSSIFSIVTTHNPTWITACIGYWYRTIPVRVIQGDCIKLCRRYSMWWLVFIFGLIIGAVSSQKIVFGQGVCLMGILLIVDKYSAYTLRKTTVHVAVL